MSWSVFYRAARGRWYAKYRDATGAWVQSVVPPEAASGPRARRAAEQWTREYVAGLDVPAPPPESTLAELAPRFLALKSDDERKATSTKAEYEGHLRLSILPQLGELRPSQLEARVLREMLRHLRRHGAEDGGPLGATTVRNRFSTLKVFLKAVNAEGWASVNLALLDDPAVLEELPEVPISRRRVLQPEGFGRLVQCAAVPPIWRIRELLAVGAGLADGEIAGLRVRDVAGGLLRITKAVALRGPEGYATESRPKNRYRVREIPQHPAITETLAWWLAEGFEQHVCRPPAPGDWLLPRPDGEACRPKSAATVREHLELAGVEVPEGFTFHALRACFATWLEQTGASDECRARLMGHRGKSTAARFYVDHPELLELDRAAIARLPIPIVDLGAGLGAGLGAPMVLSAPNLSHLRDLNPRPTVYEDAGRRSPWCPDPAELPTEPPDSTSGNGRQPADGVGRGAGVVPVPPELHELKGALRGLVTPWDAAEATLAGLGAEGDGR